MKRKAKRTGKLPKERKDIREQGGEGGRVKRTQRLY